MALERMAATWRASYVEGAGAAKGSCVFCELIAEGPSIDSGVVHVGEHSACLLNAYPYGSGHLLVLPRRHIADLLELADDESSELWSTVRSAVAALQAAYRPEGINLGANLGQAAGAGIPAHLHLHALPRWAGDTNFMTSIFESRVLPESLAETWTKVTAAWGDS
jgi:ATP adenylyltransferase